MPPVAISLGSSEPDFKIMADALLANALVLRSDSKLHDPMTANLNLSMLALGDGTLWPTIPLPPSPSVHPPISMPPNAVPMPPADSAIFMPPVAISLGSSEPAFKIMADALLTNALVLRSDSKLHDPMTANLNLSMLALGDGTLWPSIQDLDFKIMADELLTNALAIRPSLKVPYNNSLLNLAWPSLNDKEHCSYGKTKRKTTYNSTTTS